MSQVAVVIATAMAAVTPGYELWPDNPINIVMGAGQKPTPSWAILFGKVNRVSSLAPNS